MIAVLVFIVLIINVAIILSQRSLNWFSQLKHPNLSLPIYVLIIVSIVLSITIIKAWIQLRKVRDPTFVTDINWLFSLGLVCFLGQVVSLHLLHSYELALIFLFFLLLFSSQLIAMSLEEMKDMPAILTGVRVVWIAYLITIVAQLHDEN